MASMLSAATAICSAMSRTRLFISMRSRSLIPDQRRRIDQSLKEHRSVPLGQDERFMLSDRPPGGVRECGHAEIRELAPLERGRPLDQSLGCLVDPEPKPLLPKLSVALRCRRHGHLRQYD